MKGKRPAVCELFENDESEDKLKGERKMGKHEMEFKRQIIRDEAVRYLEDLIHSIRAGKVVVEKGKHYVSLSPGESLTLEMACHQKKDKERIILELSWDPTPPDVEPPDRIIISSREPSHSQASENGDTPSFETEKAS